MLRGSRFPICLAVLAGCSLTYDPDLVVARTESLYQSREAPPQDEADDLPPEADLAACLSFGLRRNAELRAAYERWRAALERIPQVSALPEPELSFAHFVEEIQTRTGPQRNRFGLSQGLPWFGKLDARAEVAAKHAEVLWAKVEALRLDVERRIKHTWYEYGWVTKAIAIDVRTLELLEQMEPTAQRRFQGGASQSDLLRLQVEIGKVENEVATTQKLAPTLAARLDAVLNRQGEPLRGPDLAEPDPVAVSLDALRASLAEHNPELAALRQEIARADKALALAGLEGYPNFNVGVEYFDTGDAMVPGTPGSGDDPFALRIGMSLPIWREKYGAARREAERSLAGANAELVDRHQALRADLELAAYHLDDAARQIALYRDSLLPRARQSFEVVRAAYRADNATLLDVIDAERMLLMFEKAYWRAVASYEQSLADLEVICGGEVR